MKGAGWELDESAEIRKLTLMPMTVEQIVNETRSFSADVRADLVERILLDGHGGFAPNIEELWKLETRRRIAEIQSGHAKGIPLEDALSDARKIVGL